jgi:hypothetical protein
LVAMGANIGPMPPVAFSGVASKPGFPGESHQVPFDYSEGEPGCEIDGIAAPCSLAHQMLANQSGIQCPPGGCGARGATYTDPFGNEHRFVTTGFQAFAGGRSGFGIPPGIQHMIQNNNSRFGRIDNLYASLSGGAGDDPPDCSRGTVPMKDEDGKWQCVGVGEYNVTVHGSSDTNNLIIDWRWRRVSTPYGSYVDSGMLRPRDSAADIAAIAQQIRTPLQNVGDTVNICGMASVAEFRSVWGNYWRSARTGNWHTTTGSYTGNQWELGAKWASMSRAATFRMIGQVTFYASIPITGARVMNGEIHPLKGGVDIGVGYIGLAGGLPGAITAATYLAYDNIPPPAYGKHGLPYPQKMNSCHVR